MCCLYSASQLLSEIISYVRVAIHTSGLDLEREYSDDRHAWLNSLHLNL